MGYDVHITRAQDWFDGESSPITLDEWLAYLNSDPDMRLEGVAEIDGAGGGRIRMVDKSLAVWTGYSAFATRGVKVWMRHFEGNIVVKNPDDEVLRKMSAIAKTFGARVQGEEGELYGEDST